MMRASLLTVYGLHELFSFGLYKHYYSTSALREDYSRYSAFGVSL